MTFCAKTPAAQLAISVGGKLYPVASLGEASRMFCAARDKAEAVYGAGASRTPSPLIYEGDKPIGYVAYNGRIFAGAPSGWTPATPILFDNREVSVGAEPAP